VAITGYNTERLPYLRAMTNKIAEAPYNVMPAITFRFVIQLLRLSITDDDPNKKKLTR
jgi:hypothetical protein